ncbi:hypothetical protein AK812_SmicGene33127 [Symbiodinium microadriaticum]|uniref:Uncharacterized protein n=1 Tax=Symbiodinium microadriaticum TaxID=2951 RepID=A0A1Q9CSF6_SYMMI|nr:hypothetical protein AK812_SmicGene33127 [Symbiodinium microadriaticum]
MFRMGRTPDGKIQKSSGNLDDLRLGIIDASLRAGDIDVAERQVLSLQDTMLRESAARRAFEALVRQTARRGEIRDPEGALPSAARQMCLAMLFGTKGAARDGGRGGDVPPEVCALLLSVAAALSAAAQMLLQTGPLSELQVKYWGHDDPQLEERYQRVLRQRRAAELLRQVATLRDAVGDQRAEGMSC